MSLANISGAATPIVAHRIVQYQERAMGTVFCFDIALSDSESERAAQLAVSEACRVLHEIDGRFSLWKRDSLLNRYRRGEIALPPPDLQRILAMCDEAYAHSDGWFDARALPGGVDPTGLVKGWAGEQALAVLRAHGFANAMVNAAGDIAVSGSPENGDEWRIGIQHPGSRQHLIGTVSVRGAIATSGCYERGAHLYDPKRKRYGACYASATVVGPALWLADALATALAIAGPEGFSFIERLPDYCAVTMRFDGTTQRSPQWSFAD